MISYIDFGHRGRLGNWLFQYAYLRSVAQRLGVKFYCPSWVGDECFALNDERERAPYPKDIHTNFHMYGDCGFDPKALLISDGTNVKGYFQSNKYFNHENVRAWYTFKNERVSRVVKKYQNLNFDNSTGLHLRFGDKEHLPQYVIHRDTYYAKALNKVTHKMHILVFSDEPECAKKHLHNTNEELIFIEGNDPYEDLYLMSCCHDFVCSSSTISWWGAWLNSHQDKIIVAPKEWFRPGYHLQNYCLCPEDWISLRTCIPFWDNYCFVSWRQQGGIKTLLQLPMAIAGKTYRRLWNHIPKPAKQLPMSPRTQAKQECESAAILFIGTGKYIEYFDRFYITTKHLFLPQTPKTYFVFTDNMDYAYLWNKPDVTTVFIADKQWPYSTLLRFHHITHIANQLSAYSHIIYIDADMYACASVSEVDFFKHDKPLFGVQHPGYIETEGSFELNSQSLACVEPTDDLSTYWQGCFWGGHAKDILEMSSQLAKRIDQDLENNIIAQWHDESHLNKYFIEQKNSVYTYDSGYAYPETLGNQLNFERKFIHLAKDHEVMRSPSNA